MEEKTRADQKCSSAQQDQSKGDNSPVGMRRHAIFRVSGQPAFDQYAGSAQHQRNPRDGAQRLERSPSEWVALHTSYFTPFSVRVARRIIAYPKNARRAKHSCPILIYSLHLNKCRAEAILENSS
jgi:hypothetical protein